jgi:Xaa-Pro aminopeptidase
VEAAHVPDVGVGPNSADPHYNLEGSGSVVGTDSVLLIDLSSRVRDAAGAPFADSTWMSYTGTSPPTELTGAFEAVREARDAAIEKIAEASSSGQSISGEQVDRVARSAIERRGLTARLIHRTGHSLGSDHVHGMGTNLDSVEFPDDRSLLPWSGFTVEPGVYFPDRFGVRLEVSVILEPQGPRVTTERQNELTLLRA